MFVALSSGSGKSESLLADNLGLSPGVEVVVPPGCWNSGGFHVVPSSCFLLGVLSRLNMMSHEANALQWVGSQSLYAFKLG
jgi:hypothetical protein